jgi:hypothetical protein
LKSDTDAFIGVQPSDGKEEDKSKNPIVNLPTDEQGYPILPSWEEIKDEGLAYKKALIGNYMREMYHELNCHFLQSACSPIQISGVAAGTSKVRVPWRRLREAPEEFIDSDYLPMGVTLTQCHHLRVKDANTLLKHWTQRKADGKIPLQFRKDENAGRIGKQASAEDNASRKRSKSNGEHQDTCKDQEQEGDGENQQDGKGSAKEGPDQQGQDTSGVSYLRIHDCDAYILLL